MVERDQQHVQDDEQDHRREVDAAHRRHEAPQRPQERPRHAVEKRRERRVRVDPGDHDLHEHREHQDVEAVAHKIDARRPRRARAKPARRRTIARLRPEPERLQQPREEQRREIEASQPGNQAPRGMTIQFVVASRNSPIGLRNGTRSHWKWKRASSRNTRNRDDRVDQERGDLREHLSPSAQLVAELVRRGGVAAASALARRFGELFLLEHLSDASVVPPLEVTFLRSFAGGSALRRRACAEPSTRCFASFSAVRAAQCPAARANAASCSMNQKT